MPSWDILYNCQFSSSQRLADMGSGVIFVCTDISLLKIWGLVLCLSVRRRPFEDLISHSHSARSHHLYFPNPRGSFLVHAVESCLTPQQNGTSGYPLITQEANLRDEDNELGLLN